MAGWARDQVPAWRRGTSRRRVGHALAAEAAAAWEKVETLTDDDISLCSILRMVKIPISDYPSPEKVREDLEAIEDTDSDEYRSLNTRLQRVRKQSEEECLQQEVGKSPAPPARPSSNPACR